MNKVKTALRRAISICAWTFAFVAAVACDFTNAATPLSTKTEKTLATSSGTVQFLAVGKPGFLKVKGEGASPTGTLKIVDGKASGEFTVDLSKFATGIALRDEHMKDKYLEVAKHPKAVLTFKDVVLQAAGSTKATIPAELELHGTKKPVSLEAELEGTKAKAKFKLKLSEFGIAIPSYAGVTIAEDVDVTIDSELIEKM